MIRNVAVLAAPEVREAHRGLRPPGWQELLMPDEMTQQGIRHSGTSPPSRQPAGTQNPYETDAHPTP